jgi:hypothetical protein
MSRDIFKPKLGPRFKILGLDRLRRLASMCPIVEVEWVRGIYAVAKEAQEGGTNISKGHIKVIAQWYDHHILRGE